MAILLILMLKISESTELAKSKKDKFEIDSNSKNKLNSKKKLDGRNEIGDNKVGNNEISDDELEEKKNYQKIFKSKKMVSFILLDFLISKNRLAFLKLRQAFIKTLILYNFDLKMSYPD